MRRISIANLMALVALIAANFAVVRMLTPLKLGSEERRALILGLLPLLDALLIGLWAVSRRFHITLERREDPRPLRFVKTCAAILALGLLAVLMSPVTLWAYAEMTAEVMINALPPLQALLAVSNPPLSQSLIVAGFLGLIISGPPLLFALVWGVGLGRYRIVLTPRD